jgi:hypothetical protein
VCALVENPDGSITIPIQDLYAVDDVDRRFTELGVRARVLQVDPHHATVVNELDWSDLYPQIVPGNGPDPWITLRPDAIPTGTTLLLVVQELQDPRGADAGKAARIMLVGNPAPERIGPVFRAPKLPPKLQ